MNDIFIEQLVTRKRRIKDTVMFIAVILAVILIPVTFAVLVMSRLILAYFLYIAFFLFVFGIWGVWFVRSHQNVEFEYQMVQDTIVVSKIIAKRKRKEIIKADVRQFDILTKSSDKALDKLKFSKVYEACADIKDGENTYYAVYQHPAYGKCALIFTPNERIFNSMKPYLKKDIVLKLFYKRG